MGETNESICFSLLAFFGFGDSTKSLGGIRSLWGFLGFFGTNGDFSFWDDEEDFSSWGKGDDKDFSFWDDDEDFSFWDEDISFWDDDEDLSFWDEDEDLSFLDEDLSFCDEEVDLSLSFPDEDDDLSFLLDEDLLFEDLLLLGGFDELDLFFEELLPLLEEVVLVMDASLFGFLALGDGGALSLDKLLLEPDGGFGESYLTSSFAILLRAQT